MKRLLAHLVAYCSLTVVVGLIAYAVAPVMVQSCLASVSPPTSGPNISRDNTGNYISNGDMRGSIQSIMPPTSPQKGTITGYLPQDWQDWSGWAKLTAHYDVVTQGCHTGGPCARIDVPRLEWGQLIFAHSMGLPSGAYTASLWIRSSNRSVVVVTLRDNSDKTEKRQFSQRVVAGPTWRRVTFSGRCAGWDNAALTVYLYSGQTSLWIDNVRLERNFDWISALLLLPLVIVGVGLTHLLSLIVSRAPMPKVPKFRIPVRQANGSASAEVLSVILGGRASTDQKETKTRTIGKNLITQGLAVSVILALLTALLLPVFAHYRDANREKICPANLHTLGLAVSMYLADSDQVYPPAYEVCTDDHSAERFRAWTYYLDPYVTTKIPGDAGWVLVNAWNTVENVPSGTARADPAQSTSLWHCPDDIDGAALSYGLNPMVSGAFRHWSCGSASPQQEWQASAKSSDVRDPAKVAWGGDTNRLWDPDKKAYTAVFPEWPRRTDIHIRTLTRPALIQWYQTFLAKDFTDIQDNCPHPLAWGCRAPAYRHGRSAEKPGRATILFCDGHVRSVPFGGLGIENIFPDLTPADLSKPAMDASAYPYRVVDVGGFGPQTFHAGAINDAGLVVGGSRVEVLAFQGGRLTNLGQPGRQFFACAYGVNAAGLIVGDFHNFSGQEGSRGFVWQGKRFHVIPWPSGYDGFLVRGVNARGQVIGRAYRGNPDAAGGATRAFLWEDGKFRDLGVPPGCISSAAYAINDAGQVVGSAVTKEKHTHAFLWQVGVMRDLGTLPGGTLSAAYGINARGEVVGDSNESGPDAGRMHPVLWKEGHATDLGILAGYRSCIAKAINDVGQVVCSLTDLNGTPCQIGLWNRQGGMRLVTSLCPPDGGWMLRDVYSLNNRGQFVCRCFDGKYADRIALVTPTGVYQQQCAIARAVTP